MGWNSCLPRPQNVKKAQTRATKLYAAGSTDVNNSDLLMLSQSRDRKTPRSTFREGGMTRRGILVAYDERWGLQSI